MEEMKARRFSTGRILPRSIDKFKADLDACDYEWPRIIAFYGLGKNKNPIDSVCKYLGRHDLKDWFFEVKKARRLEKLEVTLDKCENEIERVALSKKITREKVTALITVLKTLGKARGYSEKNELDITTGGEKINTVRLVEVRSPNTPKKID
jgi:hypothetical protein